MPTKIDKSAVVETVDNIPKQIKEFIGRKNGELSIARMKSPHRAGKIIFLLRILILGHISIEPSEDERCLLASFNGKSQPKVNLLPDRVRIHKIQRIEKKWSNC
jgi:hypothetical protein